MPTLNSGYVEDMEDTLDLYWLDRHGCSYRRSQSNTQLTHTSSNRQGNWTASPQW